MPSGSGDRPRTVRMPHRDSPARPPRAGRTTSRWMRFRSGRGSVDCRIRIAGSRSQRIRQTAVLPGRVVEHALPELPYLSRVRRFEHDAQLLQHGRVRGQPEIRAAADTALACSSESRRTRRPVRAQVDHDLGRQLHDAPGQRSRLGQRRGVEPCRRNAIDHPPIGSDLCHARHRTARRPSGRSLRLRRGPVCRLTAISVVCLWCSRSASAPNGRSDAWSVLLRQSPRALTRARRGRDRTGVPVRSSMLRWTALQAESRWDAVRCVDVDDADGAIWAAHGTTRCSDFDRFGCGSVPGLARRESRPFRGRLVGPRQEGHD